ncbi:hypothetical protein [Streptomyces sp. NPDC053427]|uniref:hypothetical protein n=1 Tax=Streptomyces sp. NPDC053427 TaxID=3365701 RepID=UPI0037D35271
MLHTIGTIFEWLLCRLLPARGCHRAAGPRTATPCGAAPTPRHPQLPVRPPELLRGEDSYLIRPYVLSTEERRERRDQRGRRRALWLAVHGYDAGPRWIHGVEVMG